MARLPRHATPVGQAIADQSHGLLPALAELAPDLAVEPLITALLDKKAPLLPEVFATMPPGSLAAAGPRLIEAIREQMEAVSADSGAEFRAEQKIGALAIIADGRVLQAARSLYQEETASMSVNARAGLLRYLVRWDPVGGEQLIRAALLSGDAPSLLELIAGPSHLPALDMLIRERLTDSNTSASAQAASLLSQHGTAEDRYRIEQRLTQWRVERQAQLLAGMILGPADGRFEAHLVRALVYSKHWTLTQPEQRDLAAQCLTDECRAALRSGRSERRSPRWAAVRR